MKMFSTIALRLSVLSLLSGVFLLSQTTETRASHIAGADITYECLGGLDYLVTYTFYRDCGGVGEPATVTIDVTSASCGQAFSVVLPQLPPTGNQIVPVCAAVTTECTGGPFPGREEWVYQNTVTLPSACTDWVFGTQLFCRNAAITTINPTCVGLYVEATLDNTIAPCNNAPWFTSKPAPFIYVGQTFCFNHGAVDIDGDSLVYSLVTPRTDVLASDTVDYIFPYTKDQPLTSVPGVTIDPVTGNVCMTPTAIEVTVMAVLVEEYRFGNLIGSVMRDIQVNTLLGANNLPDWDGINSTNQYTDTICAGGTYTFTTNTSDADVGDVVTLSSNNTTVMPTSTFTSVGAPLPTGTFTWTPTLADVRPQPYCFTITAQDDACQVNGQSIKAVCLTVIDLQAYFTSTSPGCVGQGVNFYSVPDIPGYSYLWDFGPNANPTFAQTISANPAGVPYVAAGANIVTLTITTPTGCFATYSDVVTINPAPTASSTTTAPVCAGDVVDFTNTGSTGAGYTHSWDFGSGATPANSTAESPMGITYTTSGTKTVTQTITNTFGCVTTDTSTITINAAPTANFSSTAPKCEGDTMSFTNTGSTGVGWTYEWNFGPNATPGTSTAENPNGVSYSSTGTQNVMFVITNGTCPDTIWQTHNVSEMPAASFTSTAPACANSGVNFANTGSTGGTYTYSWDFGAGAFPPNSTNENPNSVAYFFGGPKTVTLTTTKGICSATDTLTITINNTPAVGIVSNAPQCTGDSVNFINAGSTGGSWTHSWNFGTGATPAMSNTESPQGVIYSTPGIKVVMQVITDGTCSDTAWQTFTVNETPTIGMASTAPVCAEQGVNFTNTGSSGVGWSYNWDFGAGAFPGTSTTENPINVFYFFGGSKTVTLTINDANCSNSDTSTININALPTATAGTDTTICADRSVQIGAATVAGYTYNWFPSSTLDDPTISNPVASPVANQTQYVVSVVETATGCSNQDSMIVTMLAPLAAQAGIDGEICAQDSVQIGAALVEGQIYGWWPTTWLSDSTSPNPYARPDSTTIYTLYVTGAGCDTISDMVTVIVHPLPDVNAGADDSIALGASTQLEATGGVQYEWSPAWGLNNPAIYNPVASPDSTTTYILTATDVYGCSQTDTLTITVLAPSFWLPTAFTPDGDGLNDVLYVRGEGVSNFEFRVFDQWGHSVFSSRDVNTGWDGTQLPSGKVMPNGAYLYVVTGTLSDGSAINQNGLVNLVR